MKRLLVITLLMLLLAASNSYAALTCVTTDMDEMPIGASSKTYELELTCTFDTTPGTAVVLFDSTMMGFMHGKFAYTLIVDPGTPAPDAATVAISDSDGLALMTAAGNGATMVHATNTTQEYFEGPNTDHYPIVNEEKPWTLTVASQGTNSAVIYITVQLTD